MPLTNLAHANGVILHFMYQHSPREVVAALMLVRLEGVDLAYTDDLWILKVAGRW
jgi:hypothetical protein